MLDFSRPAPTATKHEIMDRVRAIAPLFAARAAEAEENRQIPADSVREMLGAGLARILVPPRFGGYGLDFDAWLDVVMEISKFDASHGWCASLIIHHAHVIAQFSEEAQEAVWACGPDAVIAASLAPTSTVVKEDGGFRVSGHHSTFASGVDHSSWAIVGGLAQIEEAAEWVLFLIPPDEYTVRDSWFMAGMRATGSNTIVTDNVFVPGDRALRLFELRHGSGPGSALHESPIYHTPFFHFAPLTFAAPMLGAAKGSYEHVREWMTTRKLADGRPAGEKVSNQVRLARAAVDLDTAELLLRRATQIPEALDSHSPQLLARSVRDFARVSELIVSAIDTILGLCGTAGFVISNPVQRAWRDIHLASMHMSLNTETNYSHFGRMELGIERDPNQPFF